MNDARIPPHEASYYHREGDALRCDLCPHRCLLAEGHRGICRSRVNRDGILMAESYGRVCAVAEDPIEKKPFFHFLPGSRALSIASTGCNLRCLGCQNDSISQIAPNRADGEYLTPEDIVEELRAVSPSSVEGKSAEGVGVIAYTYTEPLTFYEYMYDTAVVAHEAGAKNVMVSAGYVNEEPLRHLCPLLDAANIDLKSFDDDTYHRLNSASLRPVLDTLVTLREEGVWLEITNLVIPSWNDRPDQLRSMCRWLADHDMADTPLHFSRFFPRYRQQDIPPTQLATLLTARDIAHEAGIKYVYVGNVDEYRGENTHCPHCGHLLIEREGFSVERYEISEGHCPHCGTAIPGVWK